MQNENVQMKMKLNNLFVNYKASSYIILANEGENTIEKIILT